MLRCPHLMLTDAGHDGCPPLSNLVDRFNTILRKNLFTLSYQRRMFTTPFLNLSYPICMSLVFQSRVEKPENRLHVPNNRYIYWDIFPDFCRANIDVNNLSFRCELAHLTRDPIVKPHSDSNDEVGITHGQVSTKVTVHPQHS